MHINLTDTVDQLFNVLITVYSCFRVNGVDFAYAHAAETDATRHVEATTTVIAHLNTNDIVTLDPMFADNVQGNVFTNGGMGTWLSISLLHAD